ncbi:unnamed protein product [Ambrosiozyma monospora]|uniref:Unnamed protein product n=1 Tax=Ambrosiozyma monospora TaxID=43982 RepID=A0A9W6Z8M4_AMBMO|nr:unnamed protein product [Ambrosiozyma monospora]
MDSSEEEYEVADILSSPLESPSLENQSFNEFHATQPIHQSSPDSQTQRNNLNRVNRWSDSQAELEYLDRQFNDEEDIQFEKADPLNDVNEIDGSESENENEDEVEVEPLRKKTKYIMSNSISSLPSIQEQSVISMNSQANKSSFNVPSSGSIQVTSTQKQSDEPPNGMNTAGSKGLYFQMTKERLSEVYAIKQARIDAQNLLLSLDEEYRKDLAVHLYNNYMAQCNTYSPVFKMKEKLTKFVSWPLSKLNQVPRTSGYEYMDMDEFLLEGGDSGISRMRSEKLVTLDSIYDKKRKNSDVDFILK